MLRKLWNRWLPLAHKIGNFQGRIILTFLYFTLVVPFGLLVRLFADPLHIKGDRGGSAWLARETHDTNLSSAAKQG